MIGSATTAVEFFNVWGIDEIVLLDVSRSPSRREDFWETVRELSRQCFVPLTVGGWVTSPEDFRDLLQIGADKVAVNTEAVRDPSLIERASKTFGTQCVVVSIDAKRTDDGHQVFVDRGSEPTGESPAEWARRAARLGAGEVFLTSIDRDGTKEGYDLELIRSVVDAVSIPVVASGGAGEWPHLVEAVEEGNADAVSVANRFHHSQHSTTKAKEHMVWAGLNVREPVFTERFRA